MSQTSSNPATLRLPFKEKLAYGMGDLGSNILLDIGTLYLLKFYTDVLGLPGTYGGIIFLIAKFFTAFTDMGTGIMLDSRRKIGPKGKFRPFVLYAAFPVTLLAIANFVGTPFEVTGKTVMATVLFMLYGLFFSMMNCSYGAMVPAITKNPDERAPPCRLAARWRNPGSVAVYRRFCSRNEPDRRQLAAGLYLRRHVVFSVWPAVYVALLCRGKRTLRGSETR